MPYIGTPCIGMPCVVMIYIGMAYIVMTYIVMAYIGMLHSYGKYILGSTANPPAAADLPCHSMPPDRNL